jgi:hypothetical protein
MFSETENEIVLSVCETQARETIFVSAKISMGCSKTGRKQFFILCG